MKPEVKNRLIEKLVHTEDEALLGQIEEILEGSSSISDELKEELDRRMEKYQKGESRLYTWEEVEAHSRS